MHAPPLVSASGPRWHAIRLVALLAALVLPGIGPHAQAQPAPERFARPPQTPLELWYAVDYLVRVGKPDQAVPYLDRFLKSHPDDATLLQIRDRYGVGSILRLDEHPQTRAQARALLDQLSAASRRNAHQDERVRRFVDLLAASPEEQDYALDRLREAGPYAVPPLVEAVADPGRSREEQALLIRNMGRLDRTAVPALLAVLDSPDRILAGDAAEALGRIGDRRAVPFLTFHAARGEGAARRAIQGLTGRPFGEQPKAPVRVLTDEARRYHRHVIEFPGETVELWSWVEGEGPRPRTVPRGEAEGMLGLRLARQALELDPADRPAQVVLLSLALEKTIERVGLGSFPAQDPTGVSPLALAAGPDVLGDVVRQALADGHSDLAAATLWILGQVADRDALTTDRPPPLVEALSAPDRRVQYAAARALVELAPRRPFPGSSRVVPVLSRFVAPTPAAAKAVVIDGAINRANQVAGLLKGLGYEPEVAISGDQGFRLASEAADVEVIFLDPTLLQGDWTFVDTLANLRADARTAGLPIILLGSLNRRERMERIAGTYPRVAFLVSPLDAALFKRQLDRELGRMGVRPLSAVEREGYARGAAASLTRVAAQPGSPFEPDLPGAEPPLTTALRSPTIGPAASAVLGEVPGREAQRGLADVVLDASQATPMRIATAGQLSRSLQRFGPLVTADQERRLAGAFAGEADPALRTALAEVAGALRPPPESVGRRLRAFVLPATGPVAAPPAPGPPPAEAPAPNP
jgi:HEAT repeat protein